MAHRKPLQLFCLGFLSLFLELALIRFLAGNIWNLGYFPNFVLIATFVGMGMGFVFHGVWTEQQSRWWFHLAAPFLLLLLAFVLIAHPHIPGFGVGKGELGGELFFTQAPRVHAGWTIVSFALWFFGIVAIFALIAQRTAKVFRDFAPLHAYTLDIVGSCAGILSFMLISWFQIPAFLWFVALLPLFFVGLGKKSSRAQQFVMVASLLAVIGSALYHDYLRPERLETFWSPYQKVEAERVGIFDNRLFVNGIEHQESHNALFLRHSFYQAPYTNRAKIPGATPYDDVLVLGAGMGNDVAAALLNGAKSVDAVEIDPVILQLGRERHPEQPYSDPRVHVTLGDGRAFMTHTPKRYDLIVFALTDSLVKVSPMAQLRLENYLFTVDSVRRAHALLKDGGDLLFYNFYRAPWIEDKIRRMMFEATGAYPVAIRGNFTTMIAGTYHQGEPVTAMESIPTDDWPFLYIRHRQIPRLYAVVMIAFSLLVCALLWCSQTWRRAKATAKAKDCPLSIKLAFLCMGIAFLLLETKGIIQFSLLFGTTWLNSSLVFLAVLLLVLAANWVALLLRRRHLWLIYLLLMAACLLALSLPLAHFLAIQSPLHRFILASLTTFLPIFFANLLFSVTLRDQKVAEHVFGWNLIGATLGGIIEYSSMLLGYHALTLIVAACYTLAFLLLVRGKYV